MTREANEEGFDRYLTVSGAAAFLGVSVSTLRNWDRTDKLKALRHPLNGYRLYHRHDLCALLARIAWPRGGEFHDAPAALPGRDDQSEIPDD